MLCYPFSKAKRAYRGFVTVFTFNPLHKKEGKGRITKGRTMVVIPKTVCGVVLIPSSMIREPNPDVVFFTKNAYK